MSADVIQARYEQLDSLAALFVNQAERVVELGSRASQSMGLLQQGGWIGEGSSAFYAEMEGTTLPAIKRLGDALNEAGSTIARVSLVLQQAEEEAAEPFRQGMPHGMANQPGVMAFTAAGGALGPLVGVYLGQVAADMAGAAGAPAAPQGAYVVDEAGMKHLEGKANGNGECAGIAQAHFRLDKENGEPIGLAREWRPGVSLMDHPHLEKGTVIATFDKASSDGRYPNKPHNNHVALFLNYVKDKDGNVTGVRVLDQWGGRPAGERTLEFLTEAQANKKRPAPGPDSGGLLVNHANDMFVVTNPNRKPVSQ